MSRSAARRFVRQPANGTTIMTRPILIAAVVGILFAVPTSYFLTAPARQDRAATPARADDAVYETVTPAEAWPICSTMGSMVETADWATLDPDFAAGKATIVAGEWNEAITALTSAGLRDVRNADIQNDLGYANRRLRQLDFAMQHYQKALARNPRHRRRTNISVRPIWCKATSPKLRASRGLGANLSYPLRRIR